MEWLSPKTRRFSALVLCMLAGFAIAVDHVMLGAALLAIVGVLGWIDRRAALRCDEQTATAALFEALCDRWGELCAFGGYAWLLHGSPWLLAVIAAIGGSFMVSYTCARAEGLGITISGGIIQHSEQIALTVSGTLLAGCDRSDAATILGCTMLASAFGSIITAVNRWGAAHRMLAQRGRTAVTHALDPRGYEARVRSTG